MDLEYAANLRTEYAELSSNIRSALSVIWQAFSVFFAMNTLLATAAAFLFSIHTPPDLAPMIGLIIVSILGSFIAFASIKIVWRFIDYFDGMLERGVSIESEMEASTLTSIRKTGEKNKESNAPKMTTRICLIFMFLWIGVALLGISKLVTAVPATFFN